MLMGQDFADPASATPTFKSRKAIAAQPQQEQRSRSRTVLETSQHKEAEKVALSLLFRYSLLNKKMDDQVANTFLSANSFSDHQYLDQITSSIERHDPRVLNKI